MYSLKKKTDSTTDDSKSTEATVNEIVEIIISNENNINSKGLKQDKTDALTLLQIFEPYSGFTHATLDWQEQLPP